MSSYIEYPTVRGADGNTYQNSLYKKLIRTCICGLLFSVPLSAAIPNSPLLKLSLSNDNKKTLVPRMMTEFLYVNFFASTVAYWCLIERHITNPRAREGFTPYLGPLTAMVPSFACLITSHLFYPGMWAIYMEPTWRARLREFVRLNTKCFFAFANVHIPGAIGLGIAVGCLLYPFKFFKLEKEKSPAAVGITE